MNTAPPFRPIFLDTLHHKDFIQFDEEKREEQMAITKRRRQQASGGELLEKKATPHDLFRSRFVKKDDEKMMTSMNSPNHHGAMKKPASVMDSSQQASIRTRYYEQKKKETKPLLYHHLPSSSIILRRTERAPPMEKSEAADWLKKNGFDRDNLRKPNDFGALPVHEAVGCSNIRMLDWLKANGQAGGELLKLPDNAGITALHRGAMTTDEAVVRWLVRHGAKPVYKYDPFFGSKK